MPAQNNLSPAPLKTIALTSGFWSQNNNAAFNSIQASSFIAFAFSGRLIAKWATLFSVFKLINLNSMPFYILEIFTKTTFLIKNYGQ
jgi:hypothetical protein